MTWEKFWSIIDRVRAQVDMQDEASVKQFLYTELINLPQDELLGFDCAYACLYLIDRLQSSTIAAAITLLIVSVTLILILAPCNNSAIHCSNEELQDMKIAVRKRLVLYCLIIPALLLLKPLYSIVWIVAAAADTLLLVLAKIGVGIK